MTPQQLLQALRRLWFLPLVGGIAALVAVAWHPTLDSSVYLLNAHVLFSDQAAVEYRLIREPGFSLFIRAVWETLGHSDIVFLIAHGALAGLAVALATATFSEWGGRYQRLAAALITLLAPVYLVYAGMVLQQVGMAVVLAAVGLNLRWLTLTRNVRPKPLIVLAILLSLGAYWSAVFLYVAVLIGLVVALWTWSAARASTARNSRTAAGLALSVLGVAVLPWVLFQPWSAWKTDIVEGRLDEHSVQVSLDEEFVARVASNAREDPVGLVTSRALTMVTLLQVNEPLRRLPGHLFDDLAPSEDLLWSNWMGAPGATCGILDLTPKGRRLVLSLVTVHCRDWSPMAGYVRLSEPSYLYGSLASIALIGVTLWSAARRSEYLVVLAAPWSWLAVYTIAGANIDRYASPIWPFKTFLLTMLLLTAATPVGRQRGTCRERRSAIPGDSPTDREPVSRW